ncbi:acid phosphatase/Vanadium-dependent haloperoxidase [Teratosphaeria nubilosa]|uniref:Acid phosphatase/Vanadium-dependent haloperoxidase n=1 Tax=Teratosphaeria nubilosa TaxID=161662 RepID=A0A6G1L3H5_9PEZI|nr:acid phosphatase/Vanadium-dependent haloperoxidase [Teratosphaeria nubilosa]
MKANNIHRVAQWLRSEALSILTLLVFAAVSLGTFLAPPTPKLHFTIFGPYGDLISPQYAYAFRKPTMPTWANGLTAALAPIPIMLIAQFWYRSWRDFSNGVMGLLLAVLGACTFQVIVKIVIGGLRPHFFDVCQPGVVFPAAAHNGFGWRGLTYDHTICTAQPRLVKDAMMSFPSGHTAAAYASMLYLTLYLSSHLKPFSGRGRDWRLVLTLLPMLGALLIGESLIRDNVHHVRDVYFGAVLGIMWALAAYRMRFESIVDQQTNDVPK